MKTWMCSHKNSQVFRLVLLSLLLLAAARSNGAENVRHRVAETSSFLDQTGLFTSVEQDADNRYVHEISKAKDLEPASLAFELSAVLFYSAECGHCQQYAPTWRTIAKSISQDPKGNVGVFAVNCDSMREFCTSFSVDTVPSIQVFKGRVVPERSTHVEGEGVRDVLRALDKADADSRNKKVDSEDVGKSLDGDGFVDTQKELEENGEKDKGDGEEEEEGDEWRDSVEADSEDDKGSGEKFEDVNKPAQDRDNDRDEDRNRSDEENLGEEDDDEEEEEDEKSNSSGGAAVQKKEEEDDKEDPGVQSRAELKASLQRDLVRAVQCGLEQGVFLGRKKLGGAPMKALVSWLSLLSASFPGTAEREVTRQLRSDLDAEAARHGGEVESFRWDPLVAKWRTGMNLKGHDLKARSYDWETCVKWKLKDDFHGGYGCALWLLFHTLTVSSVTGGARSEHTVAGILAFVEYFFTCEECRRNFMNQNSDVQSKIGTKHGRDVILWLWKEHNSVSERINKERSSSSENLRRTFPEWSICPSCHGSIKQDAVLTRLEAPRERIWDEDSVVRFLIATYCFDDTVLHCNAVTASGYGDYVITLAFMVFFVAFVVLRYTGKQLNKKMH